MQVTITGSNDHQRRAALDALVRAFVADHGDMAVERLDAEEASNEQMQAALFSVPFLSARKLVILREPGKHKDFTEALAGTIQNLPESTDLIIYEPKLDKRLLYYKTLKKATDFKEYGEIDITDLAEWGMAYVREQGGSLNATDATWLIERVGAGQQQLKSELDKLLAYDEHINRTTIELLTEPAPHSTVFELLDAAFAGKTQRVFEIYREQRALKVEPQAMIGLIAWQLHVLAVVKTGGTRSAAELAKAARLNPFVVRKSQQTARGLSLAHIKELVSELLTIDLRLKSVAIDADEALTLYLLRLTNGSKT